MISKHFEQAAVISWSKRNLKPKSCHLLNYACCFYDVINSSKNCYGNFRKSELFGTKSFLNTNLQALMVTSRHTVCVHCSELVLSVAELTDRLIAGVAVCNKTHLAHAHQCLCCITVTTCCVVLWILNSVVSVWCGNCTSTVSNKSIELCVWI